MRIVYSKEVRAFPTSIALILALVPAAADAGDIVCGLAEDGVIEVDGLLGDWREVPGLRNAVGAAGDAEVVVKCNYTESTLYLSVLVLDDHVVRTPSGSPGEDHLALVFGDKELDVWPALPERRVARKVIWTGAGPAKSLAVFDSLQKKGWSVEVGIPLARVPGWGKGTPAVPFSLEFRDSDSAAASKTETVVTTGQGRLTWQAGAEAYAWFLEQNRLRPEDVFIDKLVDMDGEPGLERVVAAKNLVAVFSDEFSYIQLPVKTRKDLSVLKVIDLAGDGKYSLLAVYREYGGGGSRDVLAVFNLLSSGSFARTFAHEVSKTLGTNYIRNKWSLRPRGKGKRARGFELVIDAGQAAGFTAENFHETPAEDVQSILLPWGESAKAVFWFKDDQAFGG